ncbi:MAG: methyltransferase domain-containing protein [Gallionellaceae bacterium]
MTSTLLVGESKPEISLLLINDVTASSIQTIDQAIEFVEVSPKTNSKTSFPLGNRRGFQSKASPSRRLNLAISLASGEWIVPIIGDVNLDFDWLPLLKQTLTDDVDACGIVFQGTEADEAVLFAIRRRAFSYGALDERILDARAALLDWVDRIFPLPKYRMIGCEGIKYIPLAGLSRATDFLVEAASNAVKLEPATSSPAPVGYEPAHFWEQGTSEYVKWEVFQPDEPEIYEALRLTQPDSLLELGCGAGRNTRYFSKCEKYVGIDISSNLLHRAKDRIEENTLGLVRGDVVHLPFATKSFDLVFSTSTVQHIVPEKIEECIADILRVSKRYVCLIEFVDELLEHPGWFENIHMFKHDYIALMSGQARLIKTGVTSLQIQPALKKYYLFEKV